MERPNVDDIVVQSTTATQAELEHTAGSEWKQPFEKAEAKDGAEQATGTAAEEGSEAGQQEEKPAGTAESASATEAGTTEGEHERDGQGRFKGKGKGADPGLVTRLIKQRDEARNRAKELEEQLAGAEGEGEAGTAEAETSLEVARAAAPANDPEPEEKDFETYAAYVKALAGWVTNNTLKTAREKEQQSQAQTAEQEQTKQLFDAHRARIEQAKKDIPDFMEVGETLDEAGIKQSAALAIVELDNGPQVLYHLAKNPDVLETINAMSDIRAVAEIGRIAATLPVKAASNGKAAEDAASAVRTPPNKPVTTAPAPITPVGGGTARTSIPMGELAEDDYIAERRKQLGNRRN